MATLTLTVSVANLLTHACINAPLQGLRIADMQRIDALKALLKVEKDTVVEVPAPLVPLLCGLWEAIDLGTLRRVDGLSAELAAVQSALDALRGEGAATPATQPPATAP